MSDQSQPIKVLILVADDDADTRDLLKISLELKHFTVILVADGNEMVAQAKKEKPDLVVADVMMPRLNGFEAVKELRADPLYANMPVLFISCIVSGESLVSVMKKMNRCAFLEKPFTHQALLQAIEALLKQR